jgi:translation initiation factor IF-2
MTVLIQNGTLRRGDTFVVGTTFGKVKALYSDAGVFLSEAGPGCPVEVLGSESVPNGGDEFVVLPNEQEARSIAMERAMKSRLKDLSNRSGIQTLQFNSENFSQFVAAGEIKEMVLIVKADVQGSAEAVSQALERLSNAGIVVKVLHRGVGSVTENDVQLAVASKATIVAFNVRAENRAQQLAEQDGVEIMYSRIIYELVESVELAMKGLRSPEFREHALGRVEVREVFKVPRVGVVAGSYVLDGSVERNALVRLLRDNRVIYEGKMASLRRFKDDVREVAAGFECGIGIEGYQDIRNGDMIEVYKMEEVRV